MLTGEVSSTMRMLMNMISAHPDAAQHAHEVEQLSRNQTLEINPYHPIMIKLNKLRLKDHKLAAKITK